MENKTIYLGDGLYADFDGWQIRLFTHEGNEVFLEPEVVEAFNRYVKSIKK